MYKLGGQLLSALEKCRVSREDENIKGIGWFLVCVGESLSKGALSRARTIRRQADKNSMPSEASDLSVAFCLTGDQVMNWSTGLLLREKKNEAKRKA